MCVWSWSLNCLGVLVLQLSIPDLFFLLSDWSLILPWWSDRRTMLDHHLLSTTRFLRLFSFLMRWIMIIPFWDFLACVALMTLHAWILLLKRWKNWLSCLMQLVWFQSSSKLKFLFWSVLGWTQHVHLWVEKFVRYLWQNLVTSLLKLEFMRINSLSLLPMALSMRLPGMTICRYLISNDFLKVTRVVEIWIMLICSFFSHFHVNNSLNHWIDFSWVCHYASSHSTLICSWEASNSQVIVTLLTRMILYFFPLIGRRPL